MIYPRNYFITKVDGAIYDIYNWPSTPKKIVEYDRIGMVNYYIELHATFQFKNLELYLEVCGKGTQDMARLFSHLPMREGLEQALKYNSIEMIQQICYQEHQQIRSIYLKQACQTNTAVVIKWIIGELPWFANGLECAFIWCAEAKNINAFKGLLKFGEPDWEDKDIIILKKLYFPDLN